MEKLKPCPFCGGRAELHHEIGMSTQYSFCSCDNCGAKSEMRGVGGKRMTQRMNGNVYFGHGGATG